MTTAIPVQFLPDGAIGRSLDRRMRVELANSLRHIAKSATGEFDLPDDFDAAIATIEGERPVEPLAFAAYYRATQALLDENVPESLAHFRFLVGHSRPFERLETAAFDGSSPLGSMFDYYAACLDTDPTMSFGIKPAAGATAAAGLDNVLAGLDLLRRGAPEIADEFLAIVHQLVLLEPTDPNARYNFDGGSSYQLWGALALNVEKPKPVVSMAETIAHESAHSFLFGHTIEEALVKNPDDELFRSPLRPDPRPMDGIYHATFVTARMHYALDRLIGWGGLSAEDREFAAAERASDAQKFRDGLAIVDASADLSSTGRTLLRSAAEYMAGD
jgi:hypothetical protein